MFPVTIFTADYHGTPTWRMKSVTITIKKFGHVSENALFRDKYFEELAYPGTFHGQKRSEDKDRLVSVHYSDICKSELRLCDRRAAMCVDILQNKETSNENYFREIENCT